MSYKSTHTGSQIDEAVDKVLNNQVGKADWNAKEGEVGYIENKTHGYLNLTHLELTQVGTSPNYKCEIHMSKDPKYIIYPYITGGAYTNKVVEIATNINKTIYCGSTAGSFTMTYNGDYLNILFIGSSALKDKFYYTAMGSGLHQLSEEFIPDTIARVTDTEEMTSILYADLVNLRDNSKLKPGHQYRIVDYMTITTQENTQSAGHQFDIIVTADSVNVLNEKARACKPEFSIERYKDAIYYESIDNDRYEMSSVEYLGEFFYNSKKYYRYYIDIYECEILIDWEGSSSLTHTDTTIDVYPEYKYKKKSDLIRRSENGVWENWNNTDSEFIIVKNNIPNYSYFANSDLNAWEIWYSLDNDISKFAWAQEILLSPVSKRKLIQVEYYDDDIEEYETYIFVRYPEADRSGDYPCAWVEEQYGYTKSIKKYIEGNKENFFTYGVIYTSTDTDVATIFQDIEDDAEYTPLYATPETCSKGIIYRMIDEFGNDCPYDFKNITFFKENGQVDYWLYTFNSNTNTDNSMDGGAYGNVIKPYRTDDTMHINNIKFSNNCYNNTFGNYSYSNSVDDHSYSNSFGTDCKYNTFGKNCYNNTFGNNCYNNTFGNNCYINKISDYCHGNKLGDRCNNIEFGSDSGSKNYYRNIEIDNGNQYIYLHCTATTSSTAYFQNVRIGLGVNNSMSYKTISSSETNQSYETLYRPANSKTLKPDGTSF